MTFPTDQNFEFDRLSTTARQFLALCDQIMARWERETRHRIAAARNLLSPVLINTLPAFLGNIAQALSPNYPRDNATSNNNSAEAHGSERARMTSYGTDQLIHEYQILRESIAAETSMHMDLTKADWAVIDQSINLGLREAVREFILIQDELRRKLSAALSHDMRTPLATILYGAELIKLAPNLSAARQYAAKICASAERIEQMVANLLDALTSNVGETLPLTLSEFDISNLVADVCGEYRQSRAIEILTRMESVKGFWCYSSMQRALENLINNAAAYGDGSGIDIKVAQTRDRVMLSIHNTGNPIPKQRQGQIFSYLARGEGSLTAGWGLGLAFVKSVAESHGGSVAVDSSLETGTTFLIDIPVDCRPFTPTTS